MSVDYIFTMTPTVYDYNEVLPNDCTKYQIGLGAVPDEKCEVFPTPYLDALLEQGITPEPTPVLTEWVFSANLPIKYQ